MPPKKQTIRPVLHPLAWAAKTVWGPMKWRELHCRALAYINLTNLYDDRDSEMVITGDEVIWIHAFMESIPCPNCRHHFDSYMKQNPLLKEGENLTRPEYFRWTVDAHNFVNRALQKPELTYREALLLHMDQWLEPKSVE
jgi:hypothetical protein